MAGADRTTPDALTLSRALREQPYKFDFFQALRRLECAHSQKPRLGESTRPADDPVRLAQEPSLRFAPSTLAAFEPGKNGRPPRLTEYFFGLLGPNGPLPIHLTEHALDRINHFDDHTFNRFLDIFHHRLLTLFYRTWARVQPTVNFDRPQSDRFASYVGSMFGLGTDSCRNRDAMPDLAKLHFAGRFATQTGNAEGLQAILETFFQLPVRIDQFVGHWMQLPDHCCCRLGESPETGTLGLNTTLGDRVWDCQHKFRIAIGPMNLDSFQRLLPGGEALERLIAVVRNYIGDELMWDVNLILKKNEVPPLKLGESGRLGWTTWLTSRPPDEDANDLFLNPLPEAG